MLQQTDLRAACEHPNVARQRQLQARAERVAVHGGDGRIPRVRDSVVQLGVHGAQDAAATVSGCDGDDRDTRHRQGRPAGHGQPHIEVVRHPDDIVAVAGEDRAVRRYQRAPGGQRLRVPEHAETGRVQ